MSFRAAQPPNKIRNKYPKINRTGAPRRHPGHTGCAPAHRPGPRPRHRTGKRPPNICSKRARRVLTVSVHAAFSSPRSLPGCQNRWTTWSGPRRTLRAAQRFPPRSCKPPDQDRGGRRGIVFPESPTHTFRASAQRSTRPSHPIAAVVSTRNQFTGDVRGTRKLAATRAMKSLHTIAAHNRRAESPYRIAALADSRIARSSCARKRGTSTNFSG